jgi:hypothetical protein
MTGRAKQLHAMADSQLATFSDLISAMDDSTLRLPCAGREKLGDGTIGACAQHTTDNYERIAEFIGSSDRLSRSIDSTPQRRHRIPRLLRAVGHRPPDHAEQGPPDDRYTADNADIDEMLGRLSATRATLERLAELTDRQLDTIPPDGSFRFCDGQRTLEQVLTGLLKHQGHQIDALTAAIAEARPAA